MLSSICYLLLIVTFGPLINYEINRSPVAYSQTTNTLCVSKDELSVAIRRLSSPLDDPELTQVRKLILGNAERSDKCRKAAINALMTAMDKPHLNLDRDPES